ncbi:MAG: GNAT family N-acetyltransferase [Stenotrophomonas sp.]|jgi:GNAT superfamily N-acetyltransferase|nr:MAG: GNAT family N-acetyltransferase [Stenotrophomonas sp.]
MNIRPLNPNDVDAASRLCMAAFMDSVASTLTGEGVATFRKLAAAEAFASRISEDNLMWLAEVSGQPAGLIELKQGRHIAMLFISPELQRRGIGRRLLAEAIKHARSDMLTVSASLPSVPAYLGYGFHCSGEVSESMGIIYQPMELWLDRVATGD